MGIHIKRNFQSAGALWDYVSREPARYAARASGEGGAMRAKWAGSPDFPAAMRLARFGWPEGSAQMRPMAARLAARLALLMGQPQTVYDVVGECPDVGAFLSGEPEHMMRFEPEEGNTRIVRIVYNATASNKVKTDTIIRRGAVACALIDAIESAGVRVELELVFESVLKTTGAKLTARALIKAADEPLNLDRAAFVLAHPSMLRRICLRLQEMEPAKYSDDLERVRYGTPTNPTATELGSPDIYFPIMGGWESQWDYPESAERAALQILKKVGIEIHKED